MRIPNEYLTTLVQAPSVLEKLARKLKVKPRCLRVVGALFLHPHRSINAIAQLMNCDYQTARAGTAQAIEHGWVLKQPGSFKHRLTLAGLGLVENRIKRAESEARKGVIKDAPKPKRRKYVRSGKYCKKIVAGVNGPVMQ